MLGKSNPGYRISDWWYGRSQRTKIALMVFVFLVLLALCIGALSIISRLLRPAPGPETTPAAAVTPTAATPTGPAAEPTTPPLPAPTSTPAPTATLAPTAEPTPAPAAGDPKGDVGAYESGDLVEGSPAGVDVRMANIEPDLRVALQPADGAPAELAEWAADDEVLLWISLYDPIPDTPAEYREWLFSLDLDGDVETGRPAGSARINPDLGMELAVALYYDLPNDQFTTYSLVWDADQSKWTAGPSARYYLDESRTLVGLALPLGPLTEAVAETGVTIAPGAARGRAGALAGAGEQKVIDFYPDLPD